MNRYLEAHAAGREAFWHGLPIWANPLTGDSARDWTAGWKHGLVELASRCGDQDIPGVDDSEELHRLLDRYRPEDVAPVRRPRRPTTNKVKVSKSAKALLY